MIRKSLLTFSIIMLILCGLDAQNFTLTEKNQILAGDTTKMMRVLVYTDPSDLMTLNSQSIDIDPADPMLPLLAGRMHKAMVDTANPGVGIAAPQVGINRNVIWVKRYDKPGSPFQFCINPRILKYTILHRKGGEGCLSIPEERGLLYRSYAILVEYKTFDGASHKEMVDDNTAIIFQHEIDHLNGLLFPDRMREQQGEFFLPIPQGMEFYIKPTMTP
ncbi:MAG: peptide deformylase [Bacteroidales bacterium]|nr:peptide deformylase [Bacteroidales bacterium]